MPFIGQGSYGCIFSPKLKCNNNDININNSVGKIFKNTNDMEFEKEISKIIQKIDPNNEWTVPYYGSCQTNIKKAELTDNINKCSHINKNIINIEQLIYDNGGIDLKNVDYEKNMIIDDFIRMLVPLLKGLITLHNNKLFHCDIKPENILYNNKLKKLYIIDFGLLTQYSDVVNAENFSVYSYTYPYFPPEFKIYSSLIFLNNRKILTKSILTNFNNYNQASFIKFMSKYINIPNEIEVFIEKCVNDKQEFKNKFIKNYVSKFDVYSLGMSFIEIYYKLNKLGKLKINNKNLLDDFFKEVIIPMIRMDADLRYDAQKAYDSLNKLLNKYEERTVSPVKKNIIPSYNNCMKMKKKELIELLKLENKPIYGNKIDLCNRLKNEVKTEVKKSSNKITQTDCEKLKIKEIKQLLEKENKPKYGTKKQMCERLLKTPLKK